MKKISAVLFSFLLVLGLAACGEVRESASPAAGKRVVDFSGIMSNPTYAKVQEGAKLAKEEG